MSKQSRKKHTAQSKRLWSFFKSDSLFTLLIKILTVSLILVIFLDWLMTWSLVRTVSTGTVDDNALFILVVVSQLFLFLIGVFAVTYLIRQALGVVEELGQQLSQRSHDDLSPIEVEYLPSELKPLVERTNLLLADLQEAMQAQSRFVYHASHQFRTPLTALRMESELMLGQNYSDDVRQRAERIHQISDRLIHLGQQLLVLAKADSGQRIKDTFVEVDLTEWALEVGSKWVPKMRRAGIELQFEGPTGGGDADLIVGPRRSSDCVVVTADPMLLEELLGNLLDNILKYAEGAKLVTIAVKAGPPRLVVEDDGSGIQTKDEHLPFEMFYRGNNNDTTGAGLGLAIVKEIARAHSAELSLESRPKINGTRFTVIFSNNKLGF
ncbi:MAG: HAMP domain-containing sensor histidine kinase [Alcaligenaceae bacterium]|nr:HAMP domain-containing sensor histidine kinase [Alcaligenaceae bacterium]